MERNYVRFLTIEDVRNKIGDDPGQELSDSVVLTDVHGDIEQINYPIRINAFIYIVCYQGEAEVAINLDTYKVKRNQILCVSPRQVVQVNRVSGDFAMKTIFVIGNFVTQRINDLELVKLAKLIIGTPLMDLTPEQSDSFSEYYTILQAKMNSDLPYKKWIVQNILCGMIFEIEGIYEQATRNKVRKFSRQEELFFHFLDLLNESFMTERSVMFYADKLSVTPQYLSTAIKEISGQTAGEWIDKAVILEAKVMLKTGVLSIKEISGKLNFANQSFFGKYFKHHTGMSPKLYR